jgi:hypothetical protein
MKFALITEGPSENRIIKHIIYNYFKKDDLIINQIQPKIINGKQHSEGGWNEVLKYCEREELEDIFIEHDYLVIQIDTDLSQLKPFNVSHSNKNNKLKTNEELHNDIVAKLISLINPSILEKNSNNIIFAVCIHTIECWLLPIYYTNNHKSDTRTCLPTLNKELTRKNIDALPTKNKDKNNLRSNKSYNDILKNWKKKQDIIDSSKHNIGYSIFVNSLSKINL